MDVDDEIKIEKESVNLKPSVSEVKFPKKPITSQIKNKQVRCKQYQKQKRELKKVCDILI